VESQNFRTRCQKCQIYVALGKPRTFGVPNQILRDTGTLPAKEGGMGSRTLGSAVLWEETPCSLVAVYQRFGQTVSMDSSLLQSAELNGTACQQAAIFTYT